MKNLTIIEDSSAAIELRLAAALGIIISQGKGTYDEDEELDRCSASIDLDGCVYDASIEWPDGEETYEVADRVSYRIGDRIGKTWTVDDLAAQA